MEPSASEVRETLRRLRRTPEAFKQAAAGLTDEQLRRPTEPGSWSLNEVLAHVRGAADVQGGWIERILAADSSPTIRYASPRTGMRKGKYAELPFEVNLDGFVRHRRALVKALSSLAPADWARSASFTGTTPGWTQTIYDAARGMAGHEHSHFAQIASAVVPTG